ncbi:hypothetical protein FP2506_10381 [Fulvimarina pelagi HTCC2506]|uniref:Uncharacterized protein n=2 Tax=Fulvimarina pelagi TaxID=217511 RepID=Q0G520_9HYPH|nr:hypothetical protein FP2506_10381 [Fulvimarina pelagi HTCC2506]
MLCVWVVYLQLLLNSYLRQRRSSILITRGAGTGLKARCLITNMSQEPVYVTSLIAELQTDQDKSEIQLTDMRELSEDLGMDPRSAMRQGSLERGRYLDIGHFDALIEQLANDAPNIERKTDIKAVEMTVVALYGPEELPVGAKRRFTVDWQADENTRITPNTVVTQQIHKNSERRRLMQELERFL